MLHSTAMDAVLGFRLRGVERLDRIGVVVPEHAGGVGGLAPAAAGQSVDEMAVPVGDLLRRAAPIAVGGVQHVVLEVLEIRVGSLGAFEIDGVMREEQPLPRLGARPAQARSASSASRWCVLLACAAVRMAKSSDMGPRAVEHAGRG